MTRLFLIATFTLSVAAMAACGGSSNTPTAPTSAPTPPPTPTPPPMPVTDVIGQGSDTIPPAVVLWVPFTTTATGTIGATVDWTFATNDVDIALVRGTNPCTLAQLNDDTCPYVGFSFSTTAKPETLSVPNLAAGAYTLYIANFGSSDESIGYQVTLTNVPGATAMSTPRTNSARLKGVLSRLMTTR